MPHFTIEYSGNLDRHVDIGAVVELVRKAAVETGIFPLGGIRVRAVRCEHYAIADGQKTSRFSTWCCGSAKAATSRPARRRANMFSGRLSAYLDPVFANQKFALSFDMQINDKETSWKRNNIHEALKVEDVHG